MEQFLEKLKKMRQGVMLSADRKADMRHRLVQYMEAHEAVRERAVRTRPHPSSFFGVFLRPAPMFAAVMLVLVLGGGTSLAAQAALPGEPLYVVKILNEEVKGALIFDEEAKIEWETALAERRLDEAGRLAASGKLDARLEEQLQERFAKHSENVKSRIAKMESQENFSAIAGLAARFEASLDAHSRILARIDANNAANNIRSSGLALNDQVAAKRDEVKDVRTAAETKVSQSPAPESSHAAEHKVEAADKLLAQADTFRERKEPAPAPSARSFKFSEEESGVAATDSMTMSLSVPAAGSADDPTEGEVKYDLALSLLADAKAKLAAKEYAEAFRLGNEAIRMAQEAKVLLRAQKELKIKVDVDARGRDEDRHPGNGNGKDKDEDGEDGDEGAIRTYEECIAAGHPMMKSLPPKCAADGKVFVEGLAGFDINTGR